MPTPTSRTEYWKEYRQKIIEQSRKLENPLDNKAIAKIIKEIKAIDPVILEDFTYRQFYVPELITTTTDTTPYYDAIVLDIENFNEDTMKHLEAGIKLANTSIINNDFAIDHQTGLVSLPSIDKSDSLGYLSAIEDEIQAIENKIQHFPEESKVHLQKLNDVVNNKIKDQPLATLNPLHLGDLSTPAPRYRQNKVWYWTLLGLLAGSLVLVVIFVILFLVIV